MTIVYLLGNGDTALAKRDCGLPIPGGVQGRAGWVYEQSGLMEGVPTHGRGIGTSSSLRSFPTQIPLGF